MNTIALLALLICQCGPNGCPNTSPAWPAWTKFLERPIVHSNEQLVLGYRWVKVPDCSQFALYRGNTQLGNYDFEAAIYRPFQAPDSWGEPTTAPVPPPAAPK